MLLRGADYTASPLSPAARRLKERQHSGELGHSVTVVMYLLVRDVPEVADKHSLMEYYSNEQV